MLDIKFIRDNPDVVKKDIELLQHKCEKCGQVIWGED